MSDAIDESEEYFQLEYSSLASRLIVEMFKKILRVAFIPLKISPLKSAILFTTRIGQSVRSNVTLFIRWIIFFSEWALSELSSTWSSSWKIVKNIFSMIFLNPILFVLNIIQFFWFSIVIGLPIALRSRKHHRNDHSIIKDVFYNEDKLPQHTLDVYVVPSVDEKIEKMPVLIFIQGGSWSITRKELYSLIGGSLRKKGLLTIIPNYTTFPKGNMVQITNDIQDIVNWTIKNCNHYNGDPNQITLMGHSTGSQLIFSYIVKSIALSQDSNSWLKGGVNPLLSIKKVISVSGVYDMLEFMKDLRSNMKLRLTRLSDLLKNVDFQLYSPSQGIEYLASQNLLSKLPSIHLIHGTEDKTSKFEYAEKFSVLLKKNSLSNSFVALDGQSHLESLMEWMDGYAGSQLEQEVMKIILEDNSKDAITQQESLNSIIWTMKAYFLRYISPI